MRNSVKADVKVNKTNKQVVDGKISTLESSLESLEEKKQEFDEELATRQQKYDNMVKKINDNIETYQEKLDKLSSEKVDDDRQAELSDLEDEYKTHNSEYKDKVQQFRKSELKSLQRLNLSTKISKNVNPLRVVFVINVCRRYAKIMKSLLHPKLQSWKLN